MQIPSYVFAATTGDELIQEVTEHLEAYLYDPSGQTSPPGVDGPRLSPELQAQAAAYALAAGAVGLSAGPSFLLKEGSGAPGDPEVRSSAAVIFGTDDPPGTPFVRLLVQELGTPEDWADRVLQPIAFVLDCYADEWTGTLTTGIDASDAGSALASVVWRLLSPTKNFYPLLKTWGFTDPGTRAGAPVRDDVELVRPFTFGCEIYYRQD